MAYRLTPRGLAELVVGVLERLPRNVDPPRTHPANLVRCLYGAVPGRRAEIVADVAAFIGADLDGFADLLHVPGDPELSALAVRRADLDRREADLAAREALATGEGG